MEADRKILKAGDFRKGDGYSVYLGEMNPDQKSEDDYFRASDIENRNAPIYKSLFMKVKSMQIFDDIVKRNGITFQGRVLELAGGYGYLSSYLKCLDPGLEVHYSDVSEEAVAKSSQYEDFFSVRLDGKWVMSGEDLVYADSVFDTVFFFASFHHLQDPVGALRECHRILKPGGSLLLLFEPSCPWYLKPLYDLHTRRAEVKENSYTLSEYRRMLESAGFSFSSAPYRGFSFRWSQKAIVYYALLSALPAFVSRFFPVSQVIKGEPVRTCQGQTIK